MRSSIFHKKLLSLIVLFVIAFICSAKVFAQDTFTRDLRLKDNDAQVKLLQQYLNANGFSVSKTGPGSIGNETTIFGPQTKKALNNFQKANGLSIGYFGPVTRDFINKHGFNSGSGSGSGSISSVPCSNGAFFNYQTGKPCKASTGTGSGAGTGSTGTGSGSGSSSGSGGVIVGGGGSGATGGSGSGSGAGGGTTTPPTPACVINSFNASATSVQSGTPVTLTWGTSNCSGVDISGVGTNLATTGGTVQNPTTTTTYVLTTSEGLTASVGVTVTTPPPAPTCVINNFDASATTVQSGSPVTITWNTSNCSGIAITSIGTNLAASGSAVLRPTATTKYILTTSQGPTDNGVITVTAPASACAINSFTTSASSVQSGSSVTLTWSTSNCSGISISGVGTGLAASGSTVLTPTTTTTYTLTTSGGPTSSVTVTVTVSAPSGAAVDTSTGTAPVGYAMVNGTTTGGAGGTVTTVSTMAQLRTAVSGSAPKIVYVTGTITGNGDDLVYVGSNTSIIGKPGANLTAMTLFLSSVTNVIVQNLTLSDYVNDAGVQIKYGTTHVWVDHCTFFTDLDHGWSYWGKHIAITRQSDYITVSWNVFHDDNLSVLVGVPADAESSDEGYLHVTFHHNFWYNNSEREPSAYYGSIHMFNDYHLDNHGYSIGSRGGGTIRTDNEYFENDPKPISTNLAGDPPGNISGADTNSYNGSGANDITTPASTWVPPYSYSQYLDPAASVPALVQQKAGATLNT